MKIDDNYSVEKDGTLVFREKRIRKEGKDKGQEFMFTEYYFYPNTQTALKKYLEITLLEEATDVKHCIELIENTYNRIAKLS